MNYTREPIIETIITPKEGNKLLIRNSKKETREDYLVDSIEVVSFGQSIFYRSLERPKSFLLPVTDYEVVEVKETRLALKSATVEGSIKIGGGRSAQRTPSSETKETSFEEKPPEGRFEKKKDRRRSRRRRGSDEKEIKEEAAPQGEGKSEEKKRISRLLPPPPTLIAQTIGKYREALHPEATPLPDLAETPPEPEEPKKKHEREEEEPLPENTSPKEKKHGDKDENSSSFWGIFS